MKAKICILILLMSPGFYQVCGQGMIIEPRAYVTVTGGAKLIISDATNGILTIKSTSVGTGSLVVDDAAGSLVSVAAHSIVERYLALDEWHYISSPITNGLSGVFLADYLMTSSQTTSTGWAPYIVPTNVPLDVMRGYAVWKPTSNAAWREVFTGNLNNGNLSIDVSHVDGDFGGWTLVGNPYPCAVDLTAGITWNGVDPNAWFWDGPAGNYRVYGTQPDPIPAYYGGTHTGIAPAMQGFFVHATGSTATLAFTNITRVQNIEQFQKSTPNPVLVIRAQGAANSYFDLLSVQFISEATPAYDPGYDAYKLWGLNEAPQIYTLIGDTNVTCNSLPFSRANMTIPMGFKCSIAGNYTLMADSLGTFNPGISISLEDLKLNSAQNLRSHPEYNFTYNPADNSNRFILHFDNPNFGTRGNQPTAQPVQIYSFENFIYIRKTGTEPLKGSMSVYDPLGRELYTCNVPDSPVSKYDIDLPTGYYVVKLVTGESAYSKKVFISR